MKREYIHRRLGSFTECNHNFTTYVVGCGEWLGQNVELWAMGGTDENSFVRASSIAVLENLMTNQSDWTEKVRRKLVDQIYPSLRDTLPISEMSTDAFWNALTLRRIHTDDDLNFEFMFDSRRLGLTNMICVCGAAELGVEEAFVDPNSPN